METEITSIRFVLSLLIDLGDFREAMTIAKNHGLIKDFKKPVA